MIRTVETASFQLIFVFEYVAKYVNRHSEGISDMPDFCVTREKFTYDYSYSYSLNKYREKGRCLNFCEFVVFSDCRFNHHSERPLVERLYVNLFAEQFFPQFLFLNPRIPL